MQLGNLKCDSRNANELVPQKTKSAEEVIQTAPPPPTVPSEGIGQVKSKTVNELFRSAAGIPFRSSIQLD
jgi:hypothetical protein